MASPATASLSFTQKNEDTREFARREKTQVPAGIDAGPAAGLPLDGTGGFLEMSKEPRQGALPTALRDMGVPADWSDNRVVEGKFLIAVKCDTWDAFYRGGGSFLGALTTELSNRQRLNPWSFVVAGSTQLKNGMGKPIPYKDSGTQITDHASRATRHFLYLLYFPCIRKPAS